MSRLAESSRPLLTGDLPRSEKTCHDFPALWESADPDIPVLKDAKDVYEKLK